MWVGGCGWSSSHGVTMTTVVTTMEEGRVGWAGRGRGGKGVRGGRGWGSWSEQKNTNKQINTLNACSFQGPEFMPPVTTTTTRLEPGGNSEMSET